MKAVNSANSCEWKDVLKIQLTLQNVATCRKQHRKIIWLFVSLESSERGTQTPVYCPQIIFHCWYKSTQSFFINRYNSYPTRCRGTKAVFFHIFCTRD